MVVIEVSQVLKVVCTNILTPLGIKLLNFSHVFRSQENVFDCKILWVVQDTIKRSLLFIMLIRYKLSKKLLISIECFTNGIHSRSFSEFLPKEQRNLNNSIYSDSIKLIFVNKPFNPFIHLFLNISIFSIEIS